MKESFLEESCAFGTIAVTRQLSASLVAVNNYNKLYVHLCCMIPLLPQYFSFRLSLKFVNLFQALTSPNSKERTEGCSLGI